MARYRFLLANAFLLLALLGGYWGRRIEGATLKQSDLLNRLNLPYSDWKSADFAIPPDELRLLEPDATLARRYESPAGQTIELMVIAGHRKRSIHLPSYCMAGGGWETLSQKDVSLPLPGGAIPAAQARMTRNGATILATYFFTNGAQSTRSLTEFQGQQIADRFHARLTPGALVRLIVPLRAAPDAQASAEKLTADFAASLLPPILNSLRHARLEFKN